MKAPVRLRRRADVELQPVLRDARGRLDAKDR